MDPRLEEARTRREQIVAEIVARTGITETQIERLVGTFYARIRDDALLGPIFAARVEDWDTHLKKMCAFWSSVALMSGRYSGQPMQAHLPLPVDGTHFARWLAIFEETANEVCTPAGAAHFMERARRIAESLRMGIAFHRGERI
ncbi:MAG: preprotein translocase subunit TatC [Alphaproteobacteria bacterium]|nr:preprotein translocase subunit TatC [Alphaproteobacteria bacterium]